MTKIDFPSLCVCFNIHVTSGALLTSNNKPTKGHGKEIYRQPQRKTAFCPNKGSFSWLPHMLDNDQMTIGHELITLDAEICMPCGRKTVLPLSTNTADRYGGEIVENVTTFEWHSNLNVPFSLRINTDTPSKLLRNYLSCYISLVCEEQSVLHWITSRSPCFVVLTLQNSNLEWLLSWIGKKN